MEHLNVGSECVFSKLLTSNDIAMFLVMSPMVTAGFATCRVCYMFPTA